MNIFKITIICIFTIGIVSCGSDYPGAKLLKELCIDEGNSSASCECAEQYMVSNLSEEQDEIYELILKSQFTGSLDKETIMQKANDLGLSMEDLRSIRKFERQSSKECNW